MSHNTTRKRLPEEHLNALIKATQEGDGFSRERLILQFTGLAEWALQKFNIHPNNRNRDDLHQEALLAVVLGVDSYEPERGVPLIVWLSMRVRLAVLRAIRRSGAVVDRSDRVGYIHGEDVAALYDLESDDVADTYAREALGKEAVAAALEKLPAEARRICEVVIDCDGDLYAAGKILRMRLASVKEALSVAGKAMRGTPTGELLRAVWVEGF